MKKNYLDNDVENGVQVRTFLCRREGEGKKEGHNKEREGVRERRGRACKKENGCPLM